MRNANKVKGGLKARTIGEGTVRCGLFKEAQILSIFSFVYLYNAVCNFTFWITTAAGNQWCLWGFDPPVTVRRRNVDVCTDGQTNVRQIRTNPIYIRDYLPFYKYCVYIRHVNIHTTGTGRSGVVLFPENRGCARWVAAPIPPTLLVGSRNICSLKVAMVEIVKELLRCLCANRTEVCGLKIRRRRPSGMYAKGTAQKTNVGIFCSIFHLYATQQRFSDINTVFYFGTPQKVALRKFRA